MANEIKVTAKMSCTNGNFIVPALGSSEQSITQTTLGGGVPGYVSIGTGAEEDIVTTDVGTLGWVWMKNLDSTNYIQWGPKSGGVMVPVGRLKAGEAVVLRLEPGITLRMTANTGACKLQIIVLEN